MKRVITFFLVCLCPVMIWAHTPVQKALSVYRDVKGVKDYEIKGAMMTMARPFLKYYSIGPLAPDVEQMYILSLEKADETVRKEFESNMGQIFHGYLYVGKTETPDGIVDAYIHFKSSDLVDELVIYNPKIYSLYSLNGNFSVLELQKIEKKD